MAICAETPNSGRDVEWLPLSGLKVLVVEDSWIVASSLKSLLENMDIAVIGPLGNLAEATDAARAMDFDVARSWIWTSTAWSWPTASSGSFTVAAGPS